GLYGAVVVAGSGGGASDAAWVAVVAAGVSAVLSPEVGPSVCGVFCCGVSGCLEFSAEFFSASSSTRFAAFSAAARFSKDDAFGFWFASVSIALLAARSFA